MQRNCSSSLWTHRDGPPVAKLTDGVGQDEDGEPEDRQQLRGEEEHESEENIILYHKVESLPTCEQLEN